MKIRITEDVVGELDDLSDAELRGKLIDGMAAIARVVWQRRRENAVIAKGGTGGEIDALDDVVEEIRASFSAELARIREDALHGLDLDDGAD